MSSGSYDPGISALQVYSSQTTTEVTQQAISNATSVGPSGDATQITFGSMAEFKAKYPDLYNTFMNAWAMQVCMKAKDDNERFIEEMKRQRDER